jgi:hypothetical protein
MSVNNDTPLVMSVNNDTPLVTSVNNNERINIVIIITFYSPGGPDRP